MGAYGSFGEGAPSACLQVVGSWLPHRIASWSQCPCVREACPGCQVKKSKKGKKSSKACCFATTPGESESPWLLCIGPVRFPDLGRGLAAVRAACRSHYVFDYASHQILLSSGGLLKASSRAKPSHTQCRHFFQGCELDRLTCWWPAEHARPSQ